jgi:hypothetical protein
MLQQRENRQRLGIIAVLLAVLIPLVLRFALRASVSVALIVLATISISALGIARRRYDAEFPWLKYISGAVTTAVGVFILIGIVITPVSEYHAWFESFKAGIPEGGVSNIFVLVAGFYSSVLGPMILSMGFIWPFLIIAFVLLYLLAVVLHASSFIFIALLALTVIAVYYSARQPASRHRIGALIFSVAVILAALISASLFPKMDQPDGDRFVSDVAYPKLREVVLTSFPQFPLLYGVPGYGISFDEKRLGGKPTLFDNPLLRVEANPGELLYLRTRVFDTYNGTSWTMSMESTRSKSFAYNNPMFATGREKSKDLVAIEITAKNFSFIPYTLDTERIFFSRKIPEVQSGTKDVGYKLSGSLRQGDIVYLERKAKDPGLIPALSDRRQFLQIPDDLPGELRVIADGLSKNLTGDANILTNIELFLAQQFTYDLDVEFFRSNEPQDFVYSFLFEQGSGYCVQFATSFIILARLNGIPARYATGYMAYIPSDDTVGEVTGLSSHAWPEVWIEDLGWVSWEATPAVNIANYTAFDEEWFFNFNIDLDQATARQLAGLLGRRIGSSAEEGRQSTEAGNKALKIIMYIAIGLGSIILLAGAALVGFPVIRYAFAVDRDKFFLKVEKFVRRVSRRGVTRPDNLGWMAWSEVLRNKISADGEHVNEMRDLLVQVTYSNEDFKSGYISRLDDLTKNLRKHL